MIEKRIDLYYKDGGSDKVYHAQIEGDENGYHVNFQYGRRGSTLTAGTKTKSLTDLISAEKILATLYKEKTSKGYTSGEEGTVFKSTELSERITGITPQLLNTISDDELEDLIDSPEWMMQQKYDGRRLLIKKEENEITAINKKGLSIIIPEKVTNIIKIIEENIVVDGEIIGEEYFIFDILEFNKKDLRSSSAKERYEVLRNIELLQKNIVKTYFKTQEKRDFFSLLKEKEKEGAVFKKNTSEYISGRPASGGNQRKYKFWASATVKVIGHHKSKRSVKVAVYDDGKEISMGSVTIPANYEIPEIGQLVEVIYLYCHVGGSLYQSKYKGVRDDQDLTDCTYQQLKFKQPDEDEEE